MPLPKLNETVTDLAVQDTTDNSLGYLYDESVEEGVRLPWMRVLQTSINTGTDRETKKRLPAFKISNSTEWGVPGDVEELIGWEDGPVTFFFVEMLARKNDNPRVYPKGASNTEIGPRKLHARAASKHGVTIEGVEDKQYGSVCGSPDGVHPFANMIGKKVTISGFPEFQIGQTIVDGEVKWTTPGESVCANCPLASYYAPKHEFLMDSPPCKFSHRMILLMGADLETIGLGDPVIMDLSSYAVQRAMTGTRQKDVELNPVDVEKYAVTFPDVRTIFAHSKRKYHEETRELDTEWSVLPEEQYPFVVEVQAEDGSKENLVKATKSSRAEYLKRIRDMDDIKVTSVTLRLPVFEFAPEGLPDAYNPNRPVYKVKMDLAEMSISNTDVSGPYCYVDKEDPYTSDEWLMILDSLNTYMSETREYLVNSRNTDRVQEILIGKMDPEISVSKPEIPQLNAGEEDFENIEIVDEDDFD